MTGAELYLLSGLVTGVGSAVGQAIENARAQRLRGKYYQQAEREYEDILPGLVTSERSRLKQMYRGIGERQTAGYARRGMAESGAALTAGRELQESEAEALVRSEADIRSRLADRLAQIKLGQAQETVPSTMWSDIGGMAGTAVASGPDFWDYFRNNRVNQIGEGVPVGDWYSAG